MNPSTSLREKGDEKKKPARERVPVGRLLFLGKSTLPQDDGERNHVGPPDSRAAEGGGEWACPDAHICAATPEGDTAQGAVMLWERASLARVYLPDTRPPARRGGGQRGKVGAFSRQSRKRLLDTFAMLDKRAAAAAVMLTLTYPGDFDNIGAKDDLRNFAARLRRRWPKVAGIWRMEFQKRGAVHYHIILWGIPLPIAKPARVSLYHRLARLWYEVVGSGDKRHLRAGTRLECIRSFGQVKRYGAKWYSSKRWADDADDAPAEANGRHWGVVFRDDVPFGELAVRVLPLQMVHRLLRVMRGYIASRVGKRRWVRRARSGYLDCDWWLGRWSDLVEMLATT